MTRRFVWGLVTFAMLVPVAPVAAAPPDDSEVVTVPVAQLAKDGASLSFTDFAKKYAPPKRLLVSGKLKAVAAPGADATLEAKPHEVSLTFEGGAPSGLAAKKGKAVTVECKYGGTLNKAVSLDSCTLKN